MRSHRHLDPAPSGVAPTAARAFPAPALLRLELVAILAVGLSFAWFVRGAHAEASATSEPPPWTLTANAGITSQYIFRGLTQTDARPAFQGGFDFASSGGFYAGTWGSNISWLDDSGVVAHGGGLEWDVYGGYRRALANGWGIDAGLLGYLYPGSYVPGATRPDTVEVYLAGSWKLVSLKYSHAVTNTFGIPDSRNSFYIDLSVNYPLDDQWTLNGHVGRQHYAGNVNGVDNSNVLDYTDWRLGVSWSGSGWTAGAYYTDTNAKDAGYTIASRNIGRATGTVFVQRTF